MFPRLFHIGNFGLPTYGLMAALGLIFGLMLIVKLGREQGLDPDKLWNLGIIAILSGIVGAKILMILVDLGYYREHPAEIFSLSTFQAGGVWSGGFVLALIMCIWYMRRNNLPVLRTCDVFAPGLALGHAFGRVGCFAAGCCWGRETHVPWAVTFHNPLANEIVGTPLNVPLHPTQLYEMVVELGQLPVPGVAPPAQEVRRRDHRHLHDHLRRRPLFHRVLPRRSRSRRVHGIHVGNAGDRLVPGDRRRPAVDAPGDAGPAGTGQSRTKTVHHGDAEHRDFEFSKRFCDPTLFAS